MKPPEARPPAAAAVPAMPEFRDWGGLPELPLSEVLRRLLPCLRSIYAFAAVCRPWRLLLRACAADLLRPGLPPLLLNPRSSVVSAFYKLVLAQPLAYRTDLRAEGAVLLSASRGHLLLRPRGPSARIIIIDAFTGAERREITLPSPRFACHHAALSPTHLLVFHSKHAFFSLPFPNPNPNPSSSSPHWTKHTLPRSASFVTGVLEFRGRFLGLTDRAQLLEFRLCTSPQGQGQTVQMLPAAGLPDATTFDRWHFGPRLVAAGDRLLLVLFMLEPKSPSLFQNTRGVTKVAVYGLDMTQMRWEEVENIGAYSLFVDCASKSAAACIGVRSCGVEENRVYVVAPGCPWRSFPPGWEASLDNANNELFSRRAMMDRHPWPSNIWVYPQLFF
ncbi:uncharacterized protein LOC120656902 [Panicum virgatum]|uniref:KIB1-4 beta-propeller domain-containing protein n=1 Tax=Panicum virgatum TaxID=38727 RepID=A0A8T0WZF9_PANVG|nr:uncharacterized protein LOC120656902 [Panicum virgatum]KAG2653230.1 hypothetical protein PVAP13_1NG438800 [Panicum virgatum]